MFNLFKSKEKVPEWFPSKIADDFSIFIESIEEVLQENSTEYKFSDDKSVLILTNGDSEKSLDFYINNLAMTCINSDKKDWKQIITKFLNSMQTEPVNEMIDFESAKSIVRVQLYTKDILEQVKDIKLVWKEIIPETILVLVFDREDRIESVRYEIIERWGKGEDEIFELAINNTKDSLEGIFFDEIGNGSKVQVMESENIFTACSSLFLRDTCKEYNKNGIIFTIPNRNNLIILEIASLENMTKEIPFISGFTSNVFNNSPYPINSNLYWLKDGKYLKLPYEIKDKDFMFSPPQEFLDMFDSLV